MCSLFDWTKYLRVELDAIHQPYAALERESQRRHVDACVQIELLREEIRHLTLEHVIPSQQLARTLHRRISSQSGQPFGVKVFFCAGYDRCNFDHLSKGEDGLGMHLTYADTFPLQFTSHSSLPLGARGGVPSRYIVSTLQGNGQCTQHLPARYISSTFRIFPTNFHAIFPAQEMISTFTVSQVM